MCRDDMFETIVARRTIRKFKPEAVPRDLLERLIESGRLAPSAANLQPLEFIAVDAAGPRAAIFPCLKWAAYIAPAGDPGPGEEPAAYIVTLVNTKIREKMFEYDVGAAMENMILAALAEGVGGCWLLSVDRDRLAAILGVPGHYRIDSVLALGYPAEEPAAEVLGESCRYWKDAAGRLHVPKRPRAAVAHYNAF
ncbi:MAG TPA: nitroreductase family protein [Candidatus Aminicenantes bacterium]|nr:nitroreductase family protein [Candidatus Aminicenantes bacterium]HRY65592.1 nitroreductase family protein [Candidatus Aminicenantes bacterium]HRZ72520.1 nitroreductase family protein [Candidatus Aminicenantes bacterium]